MTNAEKLAQLEAKQREIADEMAELKKQMENKTWHGLAPGDKIWFVGMYEGESVVSGSDYYNEQRHRKILDNGYFFTSKPEAQRMADMLNYVGLVRRKALEMGGFLGYVHDCEDDAFVLVYTRLGLLAYKAMRYSEQPPLAPLLARECAEALAKNPEIIATAKLAWGVR